ncbi:hypothetical protein HGRIS_014266 [Hohenbuehelia grisea]|uniref:Uncharacterized protein n=1 Tax=Hohenbuehelia grisea TaxID=104357 RepID=A0ABR3JSU2_9AGAR
MSPKSPTGTRVIHRDPGFTISPASLPSNPLSSSLGTLPSLPTSPSLLSAHRPSFTASRHLVDGVNVLRPPGTTSSSSGGKQSVKDDPVLGVLSEQSGPGGEPESPEDGGNFRRSLQIDMKDLVGDAVGNMSISPASRDIVLAARRGLFIIDLESPLEVPRFLPQGGTWDVADVQWNPHPNRAEYIVSTSSEKLLIWNLVLAGKTSIEHILHKHYRAITDINWHNTECDTVASIGIDSWIWAWDLRTARKPIFGLSAFNDSGTQVKWNRQDPNMLASSHAKEVLIWDRRKGSLPVTCIQAHNSKIYGIDWSHSRRNEIITCSLDHTIKVWHVDMDNTDHTNARAPLTHNRMYEPTTMEPEVCIRTTYPVWRARSLPFAQGILSLAQRSETALEMYRTDKTSGAEPGPVESFEGHTDVVKEFVWRRGGLDGSEYQLITWSKDRTLRFWPVDSDTMQKAGYSPPRGRSRYKNNQRDSVTFRNPPEVTWVTPALSAPIGYRSILAEVRAAPPPRAQNPVLHPHHGSSLRATQHEGFSTSLASASTYVPNSSKHLPSSLVGGSSVESQKGSQPMTMGSSSRRSGTMSRGGFGGRSVARMDTLAWLSNVKVNQRRSSSSGPGSRPESAAPSRLASRSRAPSGSDRRPPSRPSADPEQFEKRRRSESQSRSGADERKDQEGNQSLLDEVTSVLKKLSAYRVILDKYTDKTRTCTIGLDGPWGSTSSVFMRVTFTFPKEYPQGLHPEGTPTVEIERNRLIPMQNRESMIRRLRAIRERRRPCLEPCLRFLLTKEEDDGYAIRPLSIDTDTSSDDELPATRKPRDITVSILRGSKNVAEPRTSQATFGPNGELICFFRAPPRIVRNVLRDYSNSSSRSAEVNAQEDDSISSPRLFQSPALVSDALRRLGQAATDRNVKLNSLRRTEEGAVDILRITTNLLTYSREKHIGEPGSTAIGDVSRNHVPSLSRRSMIFIDNIKSIAGPDRKVAMQYRFTADTLPELCADNAKAARAFGRYDHERIFMTLRSVITTLASSEPFTSQKGSLSYQIVKLIYQRLADEKDLQMLAMVAVVLLQLQNFPSGADDSEPQRQTSHKEKTMRSPLSPLLPSLPGLDYFSLARTISGGGSPRHQTPASPVSAQPSQTRSSWSSLFNAGSMRQLMVGTQDPAKDASPVQSEPTPTAPMSEKTIAVPSHRKLVSGMGSPLSPRGNRKRENIVRSPSAVSRSWNEGLSTRGGGSFPWPSSQPRPKPKQLAQTKIKFNKAAPKADESVTLWSDSEFTDQLLNHVYAYAELLFRWQLYYKRLELLNCIHDKRRSALTSKRELGIVRASRERSF